MKRSTCVEQTVLPANVKRRRVSFIIVFCMF